MNDQRNNERLDMDVWNDDDGSHAHGGTDRVMTWVSAVLMMGLGLLFAWLIISGDIRNYINTEFIAYTYLGAGILLLLGLYSVDLTCPPKADPG